MPGFVMTFTYKRQSYIEQRSMHRQSPQQCVKQESRVSKAATTCQTSKVADLTNTSANRHVHSDSTATPKGQTDQRLRRELGGLMMLRNVMTRLSSIQRKRSDKTESTSDVFLSRLHAAPTIAGAPGLDTMLGVVGEFSRMIVPG